jgi:cell division protein FtsB
MPTAPSLGGRELRRYWIAPAIIAAAIALVMIDSEAGLRSWLRLRGDLRAAEARIETLQNQITALEEETEALRSDPIAIESAIREDLHLARPGETVVRLLGDTTPRIP